jgi:hypothetical protein
MGSYIWMNFEKTGKSYLIPVKFHEIPFETTSDGIGFLNELLSKGIKTVEVRKVNNNLFIL